MANCKAPATPADISGSASKIGASVLVMSIGVGSVEIKYNEVKPKWQPVSRLGTEKKNEIFTYFNFIPTSRQRIKNFSTRLLCSQFFFEILQNNKHFKNNFFFTQ